MPPTYFIGGIVHAAHQTPKSAGSASDLPGILAVWVVLLIILGWRTCVRARRLFYLVHRGWSNKRERVGAALELSVRLALLLPIPVGLGVALCSHPLYDIACIVGAGYGVALAISVSLWCFYVFTPQERRWYWVDKYRGTHVRAATEAESRRFDQEENAAQGSPLHQLVGYVVLFLLIASLVLVWVGVLAGWSLIVGIPPNSTPGIPAPPTR
jgi:hypothetical protein